MADHDDAAGCAPALGVVMRVFTSLSAIAGNRVLERAGQPFGQSRFHEHIIRNDSALDEIRRSIKSNPANWVSDLENAFLAEASGPA